MPTFTKEVIRPARIFPFDEEGKEHPVDVGFERTKNWSKHLRKLFKKGYRIPIPEGHNEHAKPLPPGFDLPVDENGKPFFKNLGFFTGLRFERDGTIHLKGEAGESEIKKLAKNPVSIKTATAFEDLDGEIYEDVVVHVASTDKPIFTKQGDWKASDGIALSLAMHNVPLSTTSEMMNNPDEMTNSLDSVLELLSEQGIELLADTNEMNFLERLASALTAIKSHKETMEGEGSLTERPEGARTQKPMPIVMSKPDDQSKMEFVLARVAEHPINPATSEAWTPEQLTAEFDASKPAVLQLSAKDKARIERAEESEKQTLLGRAKALVGKLVISQETCDDWMKRLTSDELRLSSEQGRKSNVEELIEMSEQLRPGVALGTSVLSLDRTNAEAQQRPGDFTGPSEPTDADAEDNAKDLLGLIGIR